MADPERELKILRAQLAEDPEALIDAMKRNTQDTLPTRDVSDEAGRLLLEFSDELYLRKQDIGFHRHLKYLRHLVRIAEHVPEFTDVLTDRSAAKEVVSWINKTYDNEETNRDYRVAFRSFGRFMTRDGDDDPPESIDWVSSTTSSNYDPMPDPSKMLWWEDHILPMIEATNNKRDAAIIAVSWDSGARSGEVTELRVGDVSDHKYGLKVSVDGKQGQRSVSLVPSVPYLNQWLADHPSRTETGAPLWCHLQTGKDVSYTTKLKALKRAAERAGITHTNISFTRMRKSSASHLASQGVPQSHLEDHHGWKRGSSIASRYVAVFDDANDRTIAAAHGVEIDTEDEPDPISPLVCPRCERESPRDKEFCVWCNQAMSQSAIADIKEETREMRADFLRAVQEHPELIEDLSSMEDIVRVFDERPESLDEARDIIAALREGH